ncbi:MFS transporter [Nitritalea halalkaliphila]|uniref:MFS transporter n=1 Tax=Nitritalea halalkaliphila TaxID=590849 RepID=UPI0002EC2D4A|nr:MFS transporter [Nitritalea halalkaliphila]
MKEDMLTTRTRGLKSPWLWVPSLYLTEGIPYVIIISVSVIMYKQLGISNADIGLYTSFLYLPWVIKPIWSPFVDLNGTKRQWFLAMQALIAGTFLLIGLTLPLQGFFVLSLALFWVAAFASATNDIASDGFYLIGLAQKDQAFFLGIRSTFYRLAMITGQGLVVILAGYLESTLMDNQKAWSLTLVLVAGLMLLLTLVNALTVPKEKEKVKTAGSDAGFLEVFRHFFHKEHIGMALAFMLLYRLGESQLVKMASPFLLDARELGGLGLSTSEVGMIYGTFGVIALTLGGILGGIAISAHGLRRWMLPMIIALNGPNVFYVLLAYGQPEGVFWPAFVVIIEQFGYGFGFAAYMMYLIYIAEGPLKRRITPSQRALWR